MGQKRSLNNSNDNVDGEETSTVLIDQQPPSKKVKTSKKLNGSIKLEDTTVDDESIRKDLSENDGEDVEIVPRTRRDMIQLPYDQKLKFVSVIAQPMAGKKLAKKLFKLMRKASKQSRKQQLRIGLKEVQLRIRKGERGIIVFAGDVTPIEIMCHLPAICEDKDIPYIYVPFRTDISTAIGVRRPALMVLIKKHDEYQELYDECETKIRELMLEFMKTV
ncbi:H/ACA ribonucleoprotein complex subunit 2-like protein [Euroglyphus maynei]|uniref:H/ACA ribonucleoprotein complex subunit 2-like protein n=1 Tax=Euroglyphus maynei TaxID=6958 RepID=A0A1Y3AUA6_EURMA|nr:H/ACA ribonucleoprotein complex subunit 2-like protein [Euroglyphus maynei]